MQHMLMKATVTEATDQGTFTAVISNISVDRDGDIVEPSAVVAALHKWGPSGKKLPLAWDHQYDADFIIGHVEPLSAQEVKGEVVVDGWIDQSFDRGQHAWRLVKSGTLGFSYGFLALDASPLPNGKGFHIKAIDIFEATATPTPANADTRVLSFKSLDDLKAITAEIEQEEEERQLPEVDPPPPPEPDPEPKPTPPEPAPVEALKSATTALEREEQERSLNAHKAALEDVSAELTRQTDTAKAIAQQIKDAKDALLALELLEPDEVEGMRAGALKAVWTAAYINDLPDSAFLHVEGGGSKDADGKTTPRNLRHFPYKDANGNVDLPHLRNALARIPQSSLPQDVKDRVSARATRILDNAKSVTAPKVDATDKEKDPPGDGSRSVDPLRKHADDLALEFHSAGLDRRKPPVQVEHQKSQPEMDLQDLRRRMFEETLTLLSD